ncbi:uncharacterized protein PGTG_15157 [Puccinia graminis f. sp. tritici CRL 75-36-700-3]|uniref:Secreted protein n=1 Tax=Puccinia graminis f. sp. tritici (strain CRL 75-36-700-3 / race SCCL) TaxID=418459 RepID=E3KXJ6_PUCGT|nr:uncharacterized protein PGTG_15157 [Puccinia graminis f. sp. tritici CRL 75-36-700-3]EFP88954.2 hypothetical protein PGTG_15157 [Puccinia graminis f. sp. tritici CRL 75-36-700-3]
MNMFSGSFVILSLLSLSHADGGREVISSGPGIAYPTSYTRAGPNDPFTVNGSQQCQHCGIYVAKNCHNFNTPNDPPTDQSCDLAFLPHMNHPQESTCKNNKGSFNCYSGRDSRAGKGGCTDCVIA